MSNEPPFDCAACGRPTSGPDPYCDRCSGKRTEPPAYTEHIGQQLIGAIHE
jgi:hypothetical protein